MFDGTLGWEFVATNTDSAAQIFAYFPACLQAALGVLPDQVKPSTYTSAADASQLWTLFMSYILSDKVTELEQAVKARQSDLYTGTSGISNQLAQCIDASFSVTSVGDPITSDGLNGSSNSSSSSSSGSDHTRLDAIIGVCSALGGIALCILVFLIYRNFKRRQEVAHQHLTDMNPGGTPVPGQHFYQDSIGGQRRRSFYYAEDLLRGYVQAPMHDEVYDHRINPAAGIGGGMREQRAIVPGTISAPVLRDNV
ncbi:hypothetical protein DFH11DRAFT_1689967 [Phellopilus nigrolimitatus]|nr:hypothetical protein DFH11DRAFT_1689967 [Phellopilus nigrolimitatus]